MSKSGVSKSVWESYKGIQQMGVIVLGSLGILSWSRTEIMDAIKILKAGVFTVNEITQLFAMGLLLFTIILMICWIWATHLELRMLEAWFSELTPPGSHAASLITVFLALFLILLAALYQKLILYALAFSAFKTFEVWVLWFRDQKMLQFFKTASSHELSELTKTARETIAKYYLGRPQLPMSALFSTVCLVVIAILDNQPWFEPTPPTFRSCVAYALMMIAIILNELVYLYWRYRRNRAIFLCQEAVNASTD